MIFNGKRVRLVYLLIWIFIVVLGFLTRVFSEYLPLWSTIYLGDVLYGAMIYIFFAFVFHKRKSFDILIFALSLSFSIELSQLYHNETLDSFRNTTFGGLLLGKGFLISDLICYSIGTLFMFLLEKTLNKKA